MKKLLFTFAILTILVSCKQEKQPSAQDIINNAIEVSGGAKYEVSTISFDFPQFHSILEINIIKPFGIMECINTNVILKIPLEILKMYYQTINFKDI